MERPLGENATICPPVKCNHLQTHSFNPKAEQGGGVGGGNEGLQCDDTKETNSPAGEHTSPSERVSFDRRQHSTVLCSHNPKDNQRCQKNKQTNIEKETAERVRQKGKNKTLCFSRVEWK